MTDSRAGRTALITAMASIIMWGSFGASVHADDEPVDEAQVETGEIDGAVVAVGAPPVPAPPVVVAVGAPPVPAPPVVVAVGQPPVPQTPSTPADARSQVDVDQLTNVIAGVADTMRAALALIDLGF